MLQGERLVHDLFGAFRGSSTQRGNLPDHGIRELPVAPLLRSHRSRMYRELR